MILNKDKKVSPGLGDLLSLRSADCRRIEETALPRGAAAQPQHDRRLEIGAYLVPIGNI
jgi:hypothetical protein